MGGRAPLPLLADANLKINYDEHKFTVLFVVVSFSLKFNFWHRSTELSKQTLNIHLCAETEKSRSTKKSWWVRYLQNLQVINSSVTWRLAVTQSTNANVLETRMMSVISLLYYLSRICHTCDAIDAHTMMEWLFQVRILSRHRRHCVWYTLFNDFLFNVHFFWRWVSASICVLSWCYFYGPTFMATSNSDASATAAGTAASDTVIAMNGTATVAGVNETRCIVTVSCAASARRCRCSICHW